MWKQKGRPFDCRENRREAKEESGIIAIGRRSAQALFLFRYGGVKLSVIPKCTPTARSEPSTDGNMTIPNVWRRFPVVSMNAW